MRREVAFSVKDASHTVAAVLNFKAATSPLQIVGESTMLMRAIVVLCYGRCLLANGQQLVRGP